MFKNRPVWFGFDQFSIPQSFHEFCSRLALKGTNMAGEGLGGKSCPSMEEGLGEVAAQTAMHQPPQDLDNMIAVS